MIKKRSLTLIVMSVVAVVAFGVTLTSTRALAQSPASIPTEWYYADGIVIPDDIKPEQARKGMWSPAREWLLIFNPSSKDAAVTITFYFEDLPPREQKQTVPARTAKSLEIHEIPDVVPPNKPYGARVQSNVPVVVQPTRGEFKPKINVTEAMTGFIAYPGPLGKKETRWTYADGIVLLREDMPEEEWEWISILNPNESQSAKVKITFHLEDGQRMHEITVPSKRVRLIDVFNLPIIPKNKAYGPIIDSDVPIIVQVIRRAYAKGIPQVTAIWSAIAYPIGDRKID